MNNNEIKKILENSKTIAMVGVSSEKKGEDPKNLKRKPANVVMKYMQDFGYKVIPVNPFAVGEVINGEVVIKDLEDIKISIDIVDVFRPSKEAPDIAKKAAKIGSKVLWLQYGLHSDEAEKISVNYKMKYVSDKCIKQEYQKIFIVYGHYNDQSFNAAIKNIFIKTSEEKGNKIDCVDLYKEKFNPVFSGEKPDSVVIDHQKRIEQSDVIVLIAPIWNFRMPAIVEGWIDKILAPPWAFKFKKIFGNYGYPVGNLKGKKAVVFCTYGSPQFAIRTFFLNMPTKRLRRGVFNICGITDVVYKRFFAVPFVSPEKRKKYLEVVKKTALNV